MAAKKKKKTVPAKRKAKSKPASKAKAKAKRPAAKGKGKGKALAKQAPRVVRRPRPAPRPKKVHRRAVAVLENEEGLALAQTIARVALDKKAELVTILDVRQRASAVGYDYVVIASGESDRQLWAISEAVREVVKPTGRRPSSVEASPDWVLLNYDDVVAHLFTTDKREIYDLEGLWTDVPRVEVAG